MSFSRWYRKHGDVSWRPNVQLRMIGIRIIVNPLYNGQSRWPFKMSVWKWRRCTHKWFISMARLDQPHSMQSVSGVNGADCNGDGWVWAIIFAESGSEVAVLSKRGLPKANHQHGQYQLWDLFLHYMYMYMVTVQCTENICMHPHNLELCMGGREKEREREREREREIKERTNKEGKCEWINERKRKKMTNKIKPFMFSFLNRLAKLME